VQTNTNEDKEKKVGCARCESIQLISSLFGQKKMVQCELSYPHVGRMHKYKDEFWGPDVTCMGPHGECEKIY